MLSAFKELTPYTLLALLAKNSKRKVKRKTFLNLKRTYLLLVFKEQDKASSAAVSALTPSSPSL